MQDWLGPEEWKAVALSLRVSLWATVLSLPLGIFTAYALARWSFRASNFSTVWFICRLYCHRW